MSAVLAIFDPFEPLAALGANDNVYDASAALAHVLELAHGGDPETRSDYVKLGGMAIARVENKTTPFYSFSDPLGSAVAVWKQGGAIERERYTPFGITMDNPASLKDQAGFTGHIKDSATGLNYMQARYYDPIMGRFLSIDPVTFMDTGAPGMFNRYAYTFNDPINLIDPTGMVPGDRFDTPEEAARDAIEYINPTSIEENTEYSGNIYVEHTYGTDSDGNSTDEVVGTQFFASKPRAGSSTSTVPDNYDPFGSYKDRDPAANPNTNVGDYHTHGDYSTRGENGEAVRLPSSLG